MPTIKDYQPLFASKRWKAKLEARKQAQRERTNRKLANWSKRQCSKY